MDRLTMRTENGAALKLDNPQNEAEARKQLHDKYLIAVEKLAHYEDLEEQGRLIELPCAVGDTVWAIRSDINRNTNEWEHEIRECEFKISWIDGLGEWVFLTKEEAEAKLKELEGEKE